MKYRQYVDVHAYYDRNVYQWGIEAVGKGAKRYYMTAFMIDSISLDLWVNRPMVEPGKYFKKNLLYSPINRQ